MILDLLCALAAGATVYLVRRHRAEERQRKRDGRPPRMRRADWYR